ncbi:MAG: hypothetical protein AB7P03_05955 [Kofleriaceae bacterium]
MRVGAQIPPSERELEAQLALDHWRRNRATAAVYEVLAFAGATAWFLLVRPFMVPQTSVLPNGTRLTHELTAWGWIRAR